MSAETFQTIKQAEARQRMAAVRRAGKSRRAAVAVQRRSSLVGGGAKWRITDLARSLKAMR